ncbi:MAG: DapH/DapD/GlmU-related protein [Candidatus Methanofastidiosia archaeon]
MSTISPHATIGKDVELGESVEIGRGTIIYSNVIIGDNTKIGPYCEIGHPTKLQAEGSDFSYQSERLKRFINPPETIIGEKSVIRSQTIVYGAVKTGEKFKTGHRAFVREHTTLGRKCVVGTNAIIGGYCSIKDLTKVQTAAFVCQSVVLGRGVFVAPYVSFYDNKKIILGDYGLQAARVGDYVRIGGGSVILPQVVIGDTSVIGAGSVVTKDVPEHTIVMGNPAQVYGVQSEDDIQTYIKSVEDWE